MTAATAKKILLVDDDGALRQSLGEQLRLHEEFQTIEADNGTSALDLARLEKWPDVTLGFDYFETDGAIAPTPGSGDRYSPRPRSRSSWAPGTACVSPTSTTP